MNKIHTNLLILAGLAALTACGVQGNLKTAPPMWGNDRANYEEQRATNAQMEKQKENPSAISVPK
jgi:predicted small lipoprotein YifL